MSILKDPAGTYGSLRLSLAIVRAVGLRRALLLRQLALGRRSSRLWRSIGVLGAGSVLLGAALWGLSSAAAAPGGGGEHERDSP
jgi:hypothetical protein